MKDVFINSTEEYLIATLESFNKILDHLKITDEKQRQMETDLFAQYIGLILGKMTSAKVAKMASQKIKIK